MLKGAVSVGVHMAGRRDGALITENVQSGPEKQAAARVFFKATHAADCSGPGDSIKRESGASDLQTVAVMTGKPSDAAVCTRCSIAIA